jgi:hypothetical protein
MRSEAAIGALRDILHHIALAETSHRVSIT